MGEISNSICYPSFSYRHYKSLGTQPCISQHTFCVLFLFLLTNPPLKLVSPPSQMLTAVKPFARHRSLYRAAHFCHPHSLEILGLGAWGLSIRSHLKETTFTFTEACNNCLSLTHPPLPPTFLRAVRGPLHTHIFKIRSTSLRSGDKGSFSKEVNT